MKPKLKLLISSIIALTVASSQAIHGMENGDEEKILPNPFHTVPVEIRLKILIHASYAKILESGSEVSSKRIYEDLELVCKDWHKIIKTEKNKKLFFTNSIISAYELLGYGEICKSFLNGALIYRPTPSNNVEMITLPIRELRNPLEGTFDLSKCGDTDQYLSISTGYRKGKKAENANKLEIWLAPRFLIEKELNTMAEHFQAIFPAQWSATAPVGIFWTWGGCDGLSNYNYLTTHSLEELSNNNLYEKACCSEVGWIVASGARVDAHKKFHVHF